jgi:hypothetical protein
LGLREAAPDREAFSGWRRHPRWTLVALTLLPRAAVLIGSIRRATPFGGSAHDGYLQIAQNLVAHSMLGLDANHLLYRGPILPLLLSPGVLLGHPELWSAGMHLVASAATCLLVFAAAMTLTGSVEGSFAAAALVTLDPWLIWFVKTPMTPVTASLFVASGFYFFSELIARRRQIAASSCLGAACALGTLDHPALMAITGGFTLAILAAHWGPLSRLSAERLTLKYALVSIACLWTAFGLILLPYTIRNYRDSGRLVLVTDGGGLAYLLGTAQYAASPYPWVVVHDPYGAIAARLHVSEQDLGVQYFTVDDRFYPELNRQARTDFESALLQHPGEVAKRTAVMAAWFLAGDYSVARTTAHLLFLALVFAGWIWAGSKNGLLALAPFVAVVLPGLLLQSMTMALNGHAAYSIPYIVPLAMPLALAMVQDPSATVVEARQSLQLGTQAVGME